MTAIAERNASPAKEAMHPTTIDKLLRLAALRLEAQEREKLAGDLERIVEFVDAMQAADTEGVAPLAHPLDEIQRLRADQVAETVDRERFQALAPVARDGFYLVPRVVE